MPCSVEPGIDAYEWVQKMLCQAMKLLSVEQIKSFQSIDVYNKAGQWYFHHLIKDYRSNKGEERQIAIKELHRLGFVITEDEEHIDFEDTKGITTYGGSTIIK